MPTRAVIWTKPEHDASEEAHVELGSDRLEAKGVAVGQRPLAYRLDYHLLTGADFITSRLVVSARGEGWSRRVELDRGDDGGWSVEASADGAVELPPPGGDAAPLEGALDTDLGLSPLFNSMPALRHRLHEEGDAVEFLMAWVSVPDLAVRPLRQRYTHLRADGEARLVRYESLSESGEAIFSADLRFDADGLVVDYPGLATMEPREP